MALSTTDKATVTSLVTSSFDSAYALLGAVARQSDATALFTRIYGGTATSTSLINSRVAAILSNLRGGLRFKFTFSVLSKDEMGTTAAAWSGSKNCFYINGDWLLTVPEAERSQQLLWLVVSQMGYAFDTLINTTNDAAGQEGALLANAVLGVVPGATQQAVLNQNQAAATITLSGMKLAVEATDPAVVPPALSQLQGAVGLSALTTNQKGLWTLAVANATGRLASLVQGGGAAAVLQNLFGAAGTAAASFSASLQSQVALLTAGGLQLAVELRSAAEMNGASVAYAAATPGGGERLYVSSALLAGSNSAEQIGWLLLKGIGQALDRRLNGSLDSRGDEGATFAAAVAGRSLTAAEISSIGLDATGGVLLIGGATVAVELSDAVQNRAPVLAGAGSNASFSEAEGLGSQAAAVAVFSGINLGTGASDESSQTIRSFSLSVEGLRDGAGETLLLDGSRISLGSSGSGTTTASGLSWSLSVAADTATITFTSAAGLSTAAAAALLNGLAYQNTNTDNPSAGNRRFSLSAVQDSGGTANGGVDTTNPNLTSTVNVVAVNDAPLLGSLAAVALVDTRAQDTFNATAGSLSASDPEGKALSYGLAGASAATASLDGVSYNLSAAGAYGTLYLNSSTGQYRYQPKSDWTLNALSASGSESFTLSVSDGSSSSQALLVNFSGSVESPEQYVLVDDGAPVLTLEAQALWEQALTNASRSLADLLSRPDRDAILDDVFGNAGTDPAVFEANRQALLAAIGGTGLRIEVDLRSDAELNGALAAYAAVGHTGTERIYVNGDKLNNGQLDLTLTTSALLEEFGHAMDRRLNGEIDSPGDEGELFASQVTGVVLTEDQRALIDAQVDSAVLTIEGVQVAVEEATQGTISSTALGSNLTTTQTLNRTEAQSIDLTVTYNGRASNGADILVAAYNGSTLIGWTVYNRSTTLDAGNNNNTNTIGLTFNLAQFNPNFSSNGLTIRAWQGTAGGATAVGSASDSSPATTSGSSSTVPFTPNTNTAATANQTLSDFVTTSTAGAASSSATTTWTNTGVDAISPTVSSVAITSATGAQNSTLNAGDVVSVTVTMSEAVTVTGTPRLSLNIGGTSRNANYSSGSGTSALVFTYTIASDTDADGIGVNANITLNGGTIADGAGNPATTTFSAVGNDASYLVDTTAPSAPTITALRTNATNPTISGTASLGTGETLSVVVNGATYNNVTVTSGTWSINTNTATPSSGTLGSFADGISYAVTATVTDLAGNATVDTTTNEVTIDRTSPAVSSVTIPSGGTDNAFKVGDNVDITVSFSETVLVTNTPNLSINVGGATKTASYQSGSNSSTLTFRYTIAANDTDTNGISIAAGSINLNTGTINDLAGNAATLSYSAVADQSNALVDGTRPTLTGQFPISNATGVDRGTSIILTFSEDIRANGGNVTIQEGTNNLIQFALTAGQTNGSFSGGSSTFNQGRWFIDGNQLIIDNTGTVLQSGATNINVDISGTAITDLAGNTYAGVTSNNNNIYFATGTNTDSGAPTISSVTYGTNDGSLAVGESVTFSIVFSEVVSVRGTPALTLSNGATAVYTSGDLTNTLVYTYTVAPGATATADLALGATPWVTFTTASTTAITDRAGNVLGATAGANINPANIVAVDTTAPTINSVVITGTDNNLAVGEIITVTVNTSENVTVTGTPTYTIDVGGVSKSASYTSGSGSSALVFRYTIAADDSDTAGGITSGTSAIALAGGTLRDAAGNNLTLTTPAIAAGTNTIAVDGTAPTVSSVVNPASAQYALAGGTLSLTLNFSETVKLSNPGTATITAVADTAAGGTANITLTATGTTDTAAGVTQLTFSNNSLPTTLIDTNGVLVTANILSITSGTFTDHAGNTVSSTFSQLAATNQLVDTVVPTATVAITAVVSDTGSSSSDYITSDTTLVVNGSNGSLGSGEKVQISTDGSTWADVSVATATTWTYSDPTTRNSNLTYQVRVIDTAGNVGNSASQLVTIDTGAPTSSVGSQSVQLVEAGGTANGTAGAAAATITVTKADALTTASFDTTYLTSNGWSTTDSGVTYTKAGTYGTATFTIASGVVAYALNNSATATQALTANQPASDGFGTVQIVDTAGNTSLSSAIAFAITGTNDAPVGVNDSGSATEAGGTSNGTAGSNATGNVLNNDVDVDSAETVTAVRLGATEGAGTAGTIGTGLAGTYGTLTLNSNGSYTYVVNETNATVQALNSGGTLTDSFNYSVSDGSLTDIAVLNVTINGANDASILDLNTTDASTPQTTTLTFNAAGYDVGDVVSVVVDGVTYSHTVLANATSAENVYDAIKAVSVGGVTLANSLAADGVTWAADLTNSAVTLTSTAGAANAFTLTSEVNNANDLGVGTYRLDWADSQSSGFLDLGGFSGTISITIYGATYTSASNTNIFITGESRFENVAPGLATQLTNAGFPTTYVSTTNSFDITIRSGAAVTGSNLSGTTSNAGAGTFSTVTSFIAPTDQAAPTVSTTTTAATASNNFLGTFTENGSPILLATGGNNLSDVDNTAFNNIKVAYTTANFADGSSEQLLINGATAGGTISGLGTLANSATGTLILAGVTYAYSVAVAAGSSSLTFTGAGEATLSTAQAEALLDALQYNNTSHNPTAGSSRVFWVTPTDAGGLAGNTATFTATVVAVNDAPSITSSATASFAENGTGTVYTATATDPDNTTLTYSIAGTDAALFNINSSSGAVTFKNAPNFESPTDAGTNNVYDITVTASDGSLSSAAQAVAITVTNVNEAPSITSGATASFAENGTGTVYTATASDPDASATLTYSIAGTDAALFNINSTSGAITFKSAPNFESPADAGANNVYNITVTASDSSLSSAAQAVAITVTNVNEAPSIASVGNGSLTDTASNDSFTNITGTLVGSDVDAGTTLTYGISGGTVSAGTSTLAGTYGTLSLNTSTGAYTYTPNATAINALSANASDNFSFSVSDGTATTTTALSVHITGSNDRPIGANTSVNAHVGQPYSFVEANFPFSDADAGSAWTAVKIISLPASGGLERWNGSAWVAVAATEEISASDAMNGKLRFVPPAGATTPAAGYTSFTVQVKDNSGATDGSAYGATTTISVNLLAARGPANTVPLEQRINEDTTLSFTSGLAIAFPAATGSDGNAATVANDITTTVSIASGFQGSLTLNQSLSGGATVSGSSSSLSLRGTVAQINASLATLVYTPAANANGDQAVAGSSTYGRIQISTVNNPATIGGIPQFQFPADVDTLDINVAPVNDPIVAVADTATALEASGIANAIAGSNGSGNVLSNDTDLDAADVVTVRDTKTVTAVRTGAIPGSGTAGSLGSALTGNYGTLTLNADGSYSYAVNNGNADVNALAPGSTLTDTFNYTARDTAGSTSTTTLTITINGADDAPSITSATAVSFAENGSGTAFTVLGSDPEGSSLTYAITGGADANLFNINSGSGAISFRTAPNFEAPADAGADNVYNLTVAASDGSLTGASQSVVIQVTNANEFAPVLSKATISLSEGQTQTLTSANFLVSDADTTTSFGFTISELSGGIIQLSSNRGVAISSFTTAQLNAGLVEFAHDGGEAAPFFRVIASDDPLGDSQPRSSTAVAVMATMFGVNDVPVLNSASLSVAEGQTVTLATSDFSVSDPDNTSFTYLLSAISNGVFQLSTAPGNAITSFSTAQLNAGRVQFVHNGQEAAPAFSVTVSDGSASSATAAAAISFTNLNDAPLISAAGSLVVVENAAAAVIDAGISLSDGDSSTLSGASIAIAAGLTTGDLLGFASQNGINGSTNAATGVLTLSGNATVAQYQAALRSVTFRSSSDNPTATSDRRTISWQVNDGAALNNLSAPATSLITITPVNDAPSATGRTITILEDTATALSAADFGFSDSDGNSLSAVIITSLPGAGSLLLQGVAVSENQVIAATAIPGLVFTPPADANGSNLASIGFRVQDNGGTANGGSDTSATAFLRFDVTPVNDAPVIVSNGGGATAAFSLIEATTAITTVAATDRDSTGLTYSIGGGADQSKFAINPSSGLLSFVAPPSFANPTDAGANNVYDVIVNVSDGSLSASQAIAVTVTDAPALTINQPISANYLNALEQTSPLLIAGTSSGLADGTSVTLTVAGISYTTTVSANGWSVSLPAQDLQNLSEGTVNLTATASDANGNPARQGTASFIKDTVAPAISINTPISGGFLVASELANTLVIGGACSGAGNGRPVTVMVGGVTYATTVQNGTWSVSLSPAALQALPEGAVSVTADLSDAAGNPASQASAGFSKNTSTPTITVVTPISAGYLNAAEALLPLVLSGSVSGADGQTVTVTVGSGSAATTLTTTAAAGGWSVTVPSSALVALPQGTVAVVAAVSNVAGTTATPATASFIKDTLAPTITITTPISGDGWINAAESTSSLLISGTSSGASNGRALTLTLAGVTTTTTVQNNAWSVSVPAAALQALGQGSQTVTADLSDEAGNAASQASASFSVDTVAPATRPTVTATTLDLGVSTLPLLGGTATLAVGERLWVTVNGATYNVAVSNGTWSLDLAATPAPSPVSGSLGSFRDGLTYPVTATVIDAAGNGSSDSTTNELSVTTLAPLVPSVNAQTISDTSSLPTLTGLATLRAGESLSVTVKASGSSSGATYTNLVPLNGQWTLNLATAIPASGSLPRSADPNLTLNAGSYDVVATVTNANGSLSSSDATSGELTVVSNAPLVFGSLALMCTASGAEDSNADGTASAIASSFCITRTMATGVTVLPAMTLTYSLSGTAKAGVDYAMPDGFDPATGKGTVTFAADATMATVLLPTLNNSVVNTASRTIVMSLQQPANYSLASSFGAVATLVDNDVAVTLPTVSIAADVSVNELIGASSTATLTVQLSQASSSDVEVSWQTLSNPGGSYTSATASANVDYTATSGTALIRAGRLSTTVTVEIKTDSLVENPETFYVNLTEATNATLSSSRSVALVTINDANGTAQFDKSASTSPNTIAGDANDNLIYGGSANDTITGAGGNDTLIGGLGADNLSGGTGADLYRYTSIAQSTRGSTSQDLIQDFVAGTDKISLPTTPSGLWNAGNITAASLDAAITSVYADKDRTTTTGVGLQPLQAGEAVLFSIGSTVATRSFYLMVAKGNAPSQADDFFVRISTGVSSLAGGQILSSSPNFFFT